MPDLLVTTFLIVACVIGLLDAFLALRDLPAKVRERRLHRRNRRWVRTLPACPAYPEQAGQAGSPSAAGVMARPVITSAVPNSNRQRVQL